MPSTSIIKYRYCFTLTIKNGDTMVETKDDPAMQNRIFPKLICVSRGDSEELPRVQKNRTTRIALWTVTVGRSANRLKLRESGIDTRRKNARQRPLRGSFLCWRHTISAHKAIRTPLIACTTRCRYLHYKTNFIKPPITTPPRHLCASC